MIQERSEIYEAIKEIYSPERFKRRDFLLKVLPVITMLGTGVLGCIYRKQLFPPASQGIRVLSDPSWNRTETKKAPKKR